MAYVVITAAGNWGKGETLNEAAKTAKVRSQTVRGLVIKLDPRLYEKVEVDDHGGITWYGTDDLKRCSLSIRSAAKEVSYFGHFNLKMTKGNLSMTTIDKYPSTLRPSGRGKL